MLINRLSCACFIFMYEPATLTRKAIRSSSAGKEFQAWHWNYANTQPCFSWKKNNTAKEKPPPIHYFMKRCSARREIFKTLTSFYTCSVKPWERDLDSFSIDDEYRGWRVGYLSFSYYKYGYASTHPCTDMGKNQINTNSPKTSEILLHRSDFKIFQVPSNVWMQYRKPSSTHASYLCDASLTWYRYCFFRH